MLRSAVATLALSLMATSVAHGQEVIRNDASHGDPRPAAMVDADSDQADAEANGAWARAVLDRAAQDKAGAKSKSASCLRNPDRAAHGEVWAGVGTNGYRDYGVIATKPVGDCSQITVGFEQGQSDYGYDRGRRGRGR